MEVKRWHTLAALVCSLSLQAVALAQQPEVRTIIETLVSEEAEPKKSDDQKPDAAKSQPIESGARIRIPHPNGGTLEATQIVIKLPNGETRVIALQEAQGIVVEAQEDGEERDDDDAAEARVPKFVIGVSLSEVPDSLRAHVTLPEGVRVMAGSVFADSPAAKAGLLQYDLLLKSGVKALKSPKDLQEIVDASEGKPVSITIQRKGEQKTIEVTPVKREDAKFATNPGGPLHMLGGPGGFSIMIPEGQPLGGGLVPGAPLPGGVKVHRLPAPGMMVPQGNPNPVQVQALTDSIRHLAEQVERLKGAIDKLEKQPGEEEDDDKK